MYDLVWEAAEVKDSNVIVSLLKWNKTHLLFHLPDNLLIMQLKYIERPVKRSFKLVSNYVITFIGACSQIVII